ncbi:hypothetical protein OG205_02995 [Lentzea sp. NBC_00516]|nr:hypothetical protein [Lentzea sp. NBC_00516]WUD25988.1 hypothetical protein OG205_02995 [Lentzea sp. NBC_00516]
MLIAMAHNNIGHCAAEVGHTHLALGQQGREEEAGRLRGQLQP